MDDFVSVYLSLLPQLLGSLVQEPLQLLYLGLKHLAQLFDIGLLAARVLLQERSQDVGVLGQCTGYLLQADGVLLASVSHLRPQLLNSRQQLNQFFACISPYLCTGDL